MNKQIAFRVDASFGIGTGHVMRCIALAENLRLKGVASTFICREHDGNLLSLIKEYGFDVAPLPFVASNKENWLGTHWQDDAEQTIVALANKAWHGLVIDHYSIDATWEARLRKKCARLMVIDDLADRRHDCDILLDPNWLDDHILERYNDLIPASCIRLLGPDFSLLAREYCELRPSVVFRDAGLRRVLIFLGGSDANNQSEKCLIAMMHPDLAAIHVDLVLGRNHPDPEGICSRATKRPNTKIHSHLPSLAPLMMEADLMIGGGGSTSWERMCLALPAVVISIAANQTQMNIALGDGGYIDYLGKMDSVGPGDISASVLTYMRAQDVLSHQSRKCHALVDGLGASRATDVLLRERLH